MHSGRFFAWVFALLTTISVARAQVVWGNVGTDFITGANWAGNIAPTSTDLVQFNASAPTAQPTVNGAATVAGIAFGSAAGSFTLTGTGPLTIGSSGIDNQSTNAQTISVPLVFNAGTIPITNQGTLTLSGAITNTGTLALGGTGANGTISGAIAGNGGVAKAGSGTWRLSGANTYSGDTTVSAGTLTDGAANSFSQNSRMNVGSGATLAVNTNQSIKGLDDWSGSGGTVALANAGTTLTITGGGSSFSGTISGPGALALSGGPFLTLTGTNTYAGGTTINNSTPFQSALQIGNGGTTGSIIGAVTNNGILTFNRSDALTFSGGISGAGSVNQNGAGTLTLGGSNTYSGNTNLNTGTLADAAAGAFSPNSGLFLVGGASATLNVNFNETIRGLGGVSSSIGSTTNLGNNVVLSISPSGLTYAGAITGATGSLVLSGSGTQALTGANTYGGGTTVGAGTILQIGASGVNSGTTGSIAGNVVDNGTLIFARSDNLTFGGIVSGTGSLVQNGAGTLTLTGANTFNGPITVSNGTVKIGDGATSGSIATTSVNLNSGTLAFNRSDAVTFAGGITGSGGLTQAGPGTLILTGSNSFSGTTTVQSGTLQIGAGGTTGSLFGSLNNNGMVVFNRSDNISFGGSISGTGDLIKRGTGTLNLFNSGSSYSGKTTIESGVLAVNSISFIDSSSSLGAPSDSTKATIAIGSGATGATLRYTGTSFTSTDRPLDLAGTTGGATLDVQNSGTVNFQGAITASGAGAKTLTLTGSNTSSPNRISGAIADNSAANKTSVLKTGFGTWTLSGANTFTGGITINNGTLRLGGTNTLGTNNVAINATSGASGAMLDVANTAQAIGSLTLGGAGASAGAANHVVLGSGALTLGGDVTFNATNSPQGSYIAAASPTGFSYLFGGVLSLGGATRTFNVGDSNNAPVDLTILANISATSGEGVVKTGDGTLLLGGTSTYGGGTTVQTPTGAGKGALLLASSSTLGEGAVLNGPVGRGTLTLQAGTTLAPAGVFTASTNVDDDITLHNAVSIADGVTLGSASSGQTLELAGTVTATNVATTIRLAGDEPVIFTGMLTGAAAGTTVTFNTAGQNRSAALFGGSFGGNLTSVTADRAALIFGTPGSLANATAIKVANAGYVGVAYANGTAPSAADLLARISPSDRLSFNGTFGFDTADHESAPHGFADNLDFSNFGSNFTIGSITGAILTGTIKPTVVGTTRTYQFGNGGGILVVRSALSNDGGTTGASVNSVTSIPQNALMVIFQGNNTYTGGLNVTNSAAVLDSAGALPAGGTVTLGANGYLGYTTAFTPAPTFASFVSRLAPGGYTSSSILGLDSTGFIAETTDGPAGYLGYTRLVSEPLNLSGLNSIYLGTATSANLTGRIVAPSGGNLSLIAISKGFLRVESSLRSPDVSSVTIGAAQMVHEPGTVMLAGQSTYGGGTTLLNGTLMIDGSSHQNNGAIVAGPLGTGTLTIASSTNSATLATEGYDEVLLHNNIALGTALQIGLPPTFYGGDELKVSDSMSSYGQLTLSGAISDLGAAHGSLDVFTDLILNGGASNTFTGGVRLHSGMLTLGKDSALGAAASTLTIDPQSFYGESAYVSLYVPETRSLANNIVLNGFSGLSLEIEGPASVYANGNRVANSLNLNGSLALNGNATLELSGFPVFVNGNVTASGGFGHLDVTGRSALVLNGTANTYNGGTTAIDGAVIFGSAASIPAQPAAGLTALYDGYIGVASKNFSTSLQVDFIDRFNKGSTTGTIGFDTRQGDPTNSFSGNISLANFNSNARLGSASRAVLTGTITPLAESYQFGGGGGLLEVTPTTGGFANGNDLTRNLQVISNPAAPLTLRLGGVNTYTGGTTVGYSGLIFQQGALPTSGSIYSYGPSYVGTEETDATKVSDFLGRLNSGYSGSPVIGFDSFTGTAYSLGGTLAWPVLDNQPVFLGTSTKATISATLTTTPTLPSGGAQSAYRFAGFKGGELTVTSLLADAHDRAFSVQVGDVNNPSTYRSPIDAAGKLSTVILTGANTYSGGTDLNGGQLLFGSSSTVTGGNVSSGPLGTGALRVAGGESYYGSYLELPPATLGAASGGLTLANRIVLGSTLNLVGDNSFTLSGNIVDSTEFSYGYAPQLYKTGNGTVTLSGSNIFSGGIYVAQGSITFASATAAGTGPLQLGTVGTSPSVLFAVTSTINGLFGDSSSDTVGLGAGTTLTINQTSDSQYLGSFTSPGASLVFKGPTNSDNYRLRLGGASSYNGGTEISGGINLFVTNDNAFGPAANANNVVTLYRGTLTVDTETTISNALTLNTGTLAGTGKFQPPATLHINGSSAGHVVLAPGQGDGPGTLQFTNTNLGLASAGIVLSLEGGGVYRWQVADVQNPTGGWDSINVTGNVNITAGTTGDPQLFNFKIVPLGSSELLASVANFNPNVAYTWTVLNANSILGFNANAFAIDSSDLGSLGAGTFFFTLNGGNSLVLNFSPVPEPSTYAMLGLGVFVVAFSLRRRRRSR